MCHGVPCSPLLLSCVVSVCVIVQATVEIEYHHSMLALYKQVSPRDVVVGWYSTAGSNESAAAGGEAAKQGTPEQLQYITSLMHEVYRAQIPAGSSEPLHLEVDVSMKGGM